MEIAYLPLTLHQLSHDLRTPLTGILGLAYLLQDFPLTFEQRSYIQDIINESNKLVQLADILSQSKSLAGQMSLCKLEQFKC